MSIIESNTKWFEKQLERIMGSTAKLEAHSLWCQTMGRFLLGSGLGLLVVAWHYSSIVHTNANTAGCSATPFISSVSCAAAVHHCMGSVNICANRVSALRGNEIINSAVLPMFQQRCPIAHGGPLTGCHCACAVAQLYKLNSTGNGHSFWPTT